MKNKTYKFKINIFCKRNPNFDIRVASKGIYLKLALKSMNMTVSVQITNTSNDANLCCMHYQGSSASRFTITATLHRNISFMYRKIERKSTQGINMFIINSNRTRN